MMTKRSLPEYTEPYRDELDEAYERFMRTLGSDEAYARFQARVAGAYVEAEVLESPEVREWLRGAE